MWAPLPKVWSLDILARKEGVPYIWLKSNLFKVPASDSIISSVAAGCVVKAVVPVIVVAVNPAYVFILDAAVFLSVPPAPSSNKNKSASAIAPPISVWPVKKAEAKLPDWTPPDGTSIVPTLFAWWTT